MRENPEEDTIIVRRRNILVCPVGSYGDVHPFIGVGRELKRRGHDVTVIVCGHFRALVERAGLGYIENRTAEEYREVIQNSDLWRNDVRSFRLVTLLASHAMAGQFEAIAARSDDPDFLAVASPIAYGARNAQDKFGVPLVTLQLAPAVFPSVHRPPKLPGLIMPNWYPMFLRHATWWLAMRASDFVAAGPINRARRELGLPPARSILQWWNSPRLTVAMFPEWFGLPQPDWPDSVRCTDFPLWDESEIESLSPEASAFFDACAEQGGPIAFTPGSAMTVGESFFFEAVEACRQLDRPGVLLTRYPDQLPHHLPENVRHFDFLPLSQVLPRCSALVHHGGIGTLSQALAAGVPQLIMPMAHDQLDNARRAIDLGVGDELYPKHFKAEALAAKLARLIDDPSLQAKCRDIASRFENADGIGKTCDLIEAV